MTIPHNECQMKSLREMNTLFKAILEYQNILECPSLKKKNKVYPELEDKKLLAKLMFLAAMIIHLKELKLCLQGLGRINSNKSNEAWKRFVANYIQAGCTN